LFRGLKLVPVSVYGEASMFLPTRSIVHCSPMCRTNLDDRDLDYSTWLLKQTRTEVRGTRYISKKSRDLWRWSISSC